MKTTMSLANWVDRLPNAEFVERKIFPAIILLILALFASGAFAQSGNIYSERSVQSSSPVLRGIVQQIREVRKEASQTARYAGMSAVGALGGALASNLGGNSGLMQAALGVMGAVGGGYAGQVAADAIAGGTAYEYVVETIPTATRPAELIAIVQPEPGPQLAEGDRVLLTQSGGSWRVIKDRSGMTASR